eukprot:359673-Chlamydomonas_euryale.AAC.2
MWGAPCKLHVQGAPRAFQVHVGHIGCTRRCHVLCMHICTIGGAEDNLRQGMHVWAEAGWKCCRGRKTRNAIDSERSDRMHAIKETEATNCNEFRVSTGCFGNLPLCLPSRLPGLQQRGCAKQSTLRLP